MNTDLNRTQRIEDLLVRLSQHAQTVTPETALSRELNELLAESRLMIAASVELDPRDRRATLGDLAMRKACAPFINCVDMEHGDVTVSTAGLRADHWLALRLTAELARPGTPLRQAVQPFLDCFQGEDEAAVPNLDALAGGEWLRLKRTDARADALTVKPPVLALG